MITVQLDSQPGSVQHRTLGGRIAKIIRWLVENRDNIENQAKMTITFDCAGESVTPEVKVRHSTLKSS